MISVFRQSPRYVLLTATVLFFSACDYSDEEVLNNVETFSGEYTPPALNVKPGVTVYDNQEVTAGGSLNLVWSDEFDGDALELNTWFIQTGDGTAFDLPAGWGNNELQYYQAGNVTVAGGVLRIEAREESVSGYGYTSARITTQDLVAFRYGRIEARMKLPGGQGIWPAFWMLSQDSRYGGWPNAGEIDIMEAINLDVLGKNAVFGTIHYGGIADFPNNWFFTGNNTTVGSEADGDLPTDVFHNYAIEWDADEIRWYVDDVLYATQNSWWSDTAATDPGAAYPAPFNQAFHILLNVAVGGNLPGPPDASTVFPATMEVDWVRVYEGGP